MLLPIDLGPASVERCDTDNIGERLEKCSDRGFILLQLPGRERRWSRDRGLLGERAAAQEQTLH